MRGREAWNASKVNMRSTQIYKSILFLSLCGLASFGQSASATFSKGAFVTPKFSDSLLGFKGYSIWDGHPKMTTSVSQTAEGKTTVNGNVNWRDEGWPFRIEYAIKGIDRSKKGTKVTLKKGDFEIQVYFDAQIVDLNKAMNDVFFNGNFAGLQHTNYYQDEVVDRFIPRIFKGVLVNIPQNDKLEMLGRVDYDTKAYGIFDYKEKQYLLAVVKNSTEYNTIRVSESQRVATVIKTKLIDFIRFLHPKIKTIKSIDGMKLAVAVLYRDFLREATNHQDSLEIYLSTDDTNKFLEAEITIQDLINRSVVLLNGNRIQANLDNAL